MFGVNTVRLALEKSLMKPAISNTTMSWGVPFRDR